MYEPHHFENSPETGGYIVGGSDTSSPAMTRSQSSLSNAVGSTTVHRELYNDLVQMVPLVQSLIDRPGKSSFTRRGSMVYTKTPSRESLYSKKTDPKARNTAQSIPVKKRRDQTDKDQKKNGGIDEYEVSDNLFASSRTLSIDQDREELRSLRVQVQNLQDLLSAKDEILEAAENSKTQMTSICAELEELKLKASEQDSLLKSTQSQLSDAKIKLADKQAAFEKLQWEAMTSNKKVEKLQEDLGSMQGDVLSYMSLLEGLAKNNHIMSPEDYDAIPCHLPHSDDWDEMEMQMMEEARLSYIAAVDFAKIKQDEDSIAAAANARLCLHSLLSKSN